MVQRNEFAALTLERVFVEIRQRLQILEGEPDDRDSFILEIQELSQLKEALESERIKSLARLTGFDLVECRSALARYGWDVQMARDFLVVPKNTRTA